MDTGQPPIRQALNKSTYVLKNLKLTNVLILDGCSFEFSPSSDLFWAMRGGGAGPWGAGNSNRGLKRKLILWMNLFMNVNYSNGNDDETPQAQMQ